MLFRYCFDPVFSIVALSFVQVIDSKTELEKRNDDIQSFRPNTYCKFQANRYSCEMGQRGKFRYYYDVEKNTCETFLYGDCIHPYNVFTSLRSCKSECKDMNTIPTFTNVTANIFCRLQPEFGKCNSYYPRWYFDISKMTCRGFSYSGCGGNHNNFEHSYACLEICANVVKQCQVRNESEILSCYTKE